jgi:hypothetical protein
VARAWSFVNRVHDVFNPEAGGAHWNGLVAILRTLFSQLLAVPRWKAFALHRRRADDLYVHVSSSLPGQASQRIKSGLVLGITSLAQTIYIELPEIAPKKPALGYLHSEAFAQRLKFLCRLWFYGPSVLVSGFKFIGKAGKNFIKDLFLGHRAGLLFRRVRAGQFQGLI